MLSPIPQALQPEEFLLLPAVHLDLFCSAKGLRQVVFARSIAFSYQFYGEDWNEEILTWLRNYAKKMPMQREFPLDAEGLSPFQKKILEKLDAVAFGHTCSYADTQELWEMFVTKIHGPFLSAAIAFWPLQVK